MTEISHLFGQDLVLGPGLDLAAVSGSDETTQRLYRRLMTALGAYLVDQTYGTGLPAMVGTPIDINQLTSIVRAQTLLEASVDQTQPISVDAVFTPLTGAMVVTVAYTDSSGQPQQLELT